MWRASPENSGTSCWNQEIFYTLAEAKVLIERWRQGYNQVPPQSALCSPGPESQRLQEFRGLSSRGKS